MLGSATQKSIIIDEKNSNKVLVRKLALVVDGRKDLEINFTEKYEKSDASKESTFVIKEGISYRIKIDFQVQREIVTGLKYVQKTYRAGMCVDKMSHMVGSYAPKEEIQSFLTPIDEAPSGLMSRGTYTVKSVFTDDDGYEHLKWNWSFQIKKDWE